MDKRIKKVAAAGISAAVTLCGVFLSWPAMAANYTPVAGSSTNNPTFQSITKALAVCVTLLLFKIAPS